MRFNPQTIGFRPTWAEVNLDNLSHNLSQIRRCVGPRTRIMACVKADAYGHGLVPVARKLLAQGVDYFAVASIDEAIRLRKAEIYTPILILGVVLERDIEPLFRYAVTPTVCTRQFLAALEKAGRSFGRTIPAHVKVDTGMARIGVSSAQTLDFLRSLRAFKYVRLEGLFTHLSSADCDRQQTMRQIRIFQRLVDDCRAQGIDVPLVHAANSMGVAGYPESHFNMVRPGLILYGLSPRKKLGLALKPVLSLKTAVIFTKQVPAGTGISYGHTYVTRKAGTIATLPIGYGDGYPRNLSNCGPVLINGKRYRISGRVCMDQIMVDTGRDRVKPGDAVVLIGTMAGEKISAEELAGMSGTISYEIVCGLGSRVPRVYLQRSASGRKEEVIPATRRSGMSERRDFVRYSCSLPLTVAPFSADGACTAQTRDISASGLGIVTSRPLDPAGEYQIKFSSSEKPLRSRVAWTQECGAQTYRSGLRLTNPDLLEMCKEFAAC